MWGPMSISRFDGNEVAGLEAVPLVFSLKLMIILDVVDNTGIIAPRHNQEMSGGSNAGRRCIQFRRGWCA